MTSNMLGQILTLITPTTVLVFIFFLLLTYYVINLPRSLNMPPGPFPLPVIGSLHQIIKRPKKGDVTIFQSLARKYGKLITLKLGSAYMVIISDYTLLQEAFVKRSDAFSNRPIKTLYAMHYLNEELGAGLISNHGPVWKQLRRTALMTMRDFGVGKQSLEEKIQEEIRVVLGCFGEHNGQPFYTKPFFSLATSNVICGIIFGSRFDYEDSKFKELLRNLDVSFKVNPNFFIVNYFPYLKHIPIFLKGLRQFSSTLRLTTQYVKELTVSNETTYDPENIRDFVDLFIKMRREHNDDNTYDERYMTRVIVDLFSAGSDSTAHTLAWAMLYMAKFPDVQTRCQRDIDDVLGKGKIASMADKEKLPYVEATTLEVLRIRPAGATAVPHCTSKDVEFHGYNIPENTIVMANLIAINNDPETFPNPEQFDPDHFLSKEGNVINREKIVSFSLGPRSCLGEIVAKMELNLFFTSILQFFTISPEPGKLIDLKPVLGTLLLRHEPQNLVFTRRE